MDKSCIDQNAMNSCNNGHNADEEDTLPSALVMLMREVYKPAGLTVTGLSLESESAEYSACRLRLDDYNIAFRVAKTTPTKIGQFVTIWKRPAPGVVIAPFDLSDELDFVVICVFDSMHLGQFIFDKEILLAKDIMSRNGKGGKRAIRVYPPWVNTVAKEAIKTQKWQLPYFCLTEKRDGATDLNRIRKLFKL